MSQKSWTGSPPEMQELTVELMRGLVVALVDNRGILIKIERNVNIFQLRVLPHSPTVNS